MIYYLSYIRNGGQLCIPFFNRIINQWCIALITVVLLQEGKSSGLSGAISGGAEQLFGKQNNIGVDLFLIRLIIILSIFFFVPMICISYLDM